MPYLDTANQHPIPAPLQFSRKLRGRCGPGDHPRENTVLSGSVDAAIAQRVAGSGKEHTQGSGPGTTGNPPPGPRGSRQCFGRPAEGSTASRGLWGGARLRAQAHGSPQDWMAPISPGLKLPREPNRQGRGLEAGGAVGAGGAGQVQVRRAAGARWDAGEGRGAAAQERAGRLGSSHGLERKMPLVPTEEWTVAPATTGRSWGGIRAGPGQSEVRGR